MRPPAGLALRHVLGENPPVRHFRRRRGPLRLPQDVAASGSRSAPDLEQFRGSVEQYAEVHATALASVDFEERCRACWGLVARGSEALRWIWDRLHHGSPDEIADAAGILQWVGLPVEWEPPLSALAETLPDGEPKDVLYDALGHVEAAESVDGLLFHGSTLPFTEPIWYVNVAFDPAAAEAESWAGGLGWSCTRFRQPLSEALSRMEPWAIPSWKAILVGTTGSWTALFSQGSDIYHTDVIGKRLGVRSLRTHFSPHIVRDGKVVTPGDRAFWLNGNGSGHGDRTIQASYQSRWTWGLRGEQQTFEDLGRYAARQVTARFDLDMLDRYCEALGIRRADPDFYTEDCLLIEQDVSRWAHRPSNTLSAAEWRRRRL